MPSAIARLRALVHCVLLCSLLTTWLGKPVDVVASLGTHMALVCSYPQRPGHPANQTRQLSGTTSSATRFSQIAKAKFEKFKVRSSKLSFFRFRNSQKINFVDFAFLDFS